MFIFVKCKKIVSCISPCSFQLLIVLFSSVIQQSINIHWENAFVLNRVLILIYKFCLLQQTRLVPWRLEVPFNVSGRRKEHTLAHCKFVKTVHQMSILNFDSYRKFTNSNLTDNDTYLFLIAVTYKRVIN